MHFEILVEDASGKRLLEHLMPKILSEPHTSRIISYKGIGHIPKNLHRARTDAAQRVLLDQLPRILRGYGNSLPPESAVVVVVDCDERPCGPFKQELLTVLAHCRPAPRTVFRIAVEEIEAWLLGDLRAVQAAFPGAKRQVLASYVQDSVCGTWETLADAVYPGGATALSAEGWFRVGQVKSEWAERIGPEMDIAGNQSPSFRAFRDALVRLTSG